MLKFVRAYRKMSRKLIYLKLMLPRRRGCLVRLSLLMLTAFSLASGWWLAGVVSEALLPPQPSQALEHFALDRNLKNYLDSIYLLVEPSRTVCSEGKEFDVLVLVTSSPFRFLQRQAIRDTWGKHVPTYFVIGLDGSSVDDLLVDNYVEAKKYSDIIIYGFQDHYQNLTLKSALMLQWTYLRCPSRMMLFKTDDDVLVNPWMLRRVVAEHSGDDLIGYKKTNNYLHRDPYNKWYLPRWLYRCDLVPEYLSGTGYLIKGSQIGDVFKAAFDVPIINLEDVYFTYVVSKLKLGLTLTHDHRLSPYKPWLPLECMYWGLASTHSLSPSEMLRAWPSIEALGKSYDSGYDKCDYFVLNIWSELFLY